MPLVAVVNDYLAGEGRPKSRERFPAPGWPTIRSTQSPADDVDAVLLATPGPTHEKQLLACLEHRKPVLCEKPLTTEVETSLEVVAA